MTGGRPLVLFGALLFSMVCVPLRSAAQPAQPALPAQLQRAGVDQRLGAMVPLDTRLTDHTGAGVRLGDYFAGQPVLLVPVYYDCPMLCTMVLEGMARTLKAVSLEPGQDFEIVVVSFDSTETSDQASRRRLSTLERYARPSAESAMHFLTGQEAEISQLMEAVGFGYQFDESSGEFAHSATMIVLTPEGRISHYLPGVEFPPRDVRLALVESAQNEIGTAVDRVMLYCFRYDPATGQYTAATMNILRAAGILTLVLMGVFVGRHLLRDRRRAAVLEAGS